MKKKVLLLVIILCIVLFFPYLKAEYLTLLHGEEFIGLEQQTNMLNQSKYLKVLEYSSTEAKIFYVSDTGDIITFVKDENNQWKKKEWITIWSTSGSADSFYWPYYR